MAILSNNINGNRLSTAEEVDMTHMTAADARNVMWLRTNYRPIGELFDEGQLTVSNLKWAAAKAYDVKIRLAAKILLEQFEDVSKKVNNTQISQATEQSNNIQSIITPLTLQRARSTVWPFGQQKGRVIGDLLDEHSISLKDLGFAAESAWDRKVQAAAKTLLIAKLSEAIHEPQPRRAPPHMVAGGRSFSEHQQLVWMLNAGVIIGIIAGIAIGNFLNVIVREIRQPSLPADSASISAVKSLGATEIIIGIAIFAIICFLVWKVFLVLSDAIMDRFEARLKRLRQGQVGEERTISILHFALDESWYIFRNLELPGRNRADIDVVIVGPPGVFALEVKAYHGLYRNIGENWDYRAKDKWQSVRQNPSQQAKRNSARLSTFFKANGVDQWVMPIVVWANPSSQVEIENASVAVWPLSRLPEEMGNLWGNQTANDVAKQRIIDMLIKLTDHKQAESQRR